MTPPESIPDTNDEREYGSQFFYPDGDLSLLEDEPFNREFTIGGWVRKQWRSSSPLTIAAHIGGVVALSLAVILIFRFYAHQQDNILRWRP